MLKCKIVGLGHVYKVYLYKLDDNLENFTIICVFRI